MYISDIIEFQVKPLYRDESFLRQKYLVERLSPGQIASAIGAGRTTVARHLKEFGIRLRTEDEAKKLHRALAFGERIQDGKIVLCKREQETIEMVQKLRAQGMGLQAIADFLTSMNIPTKTKKGKWQVSMVWYVLKGRRSQQER